MRMKCHGDLLQRENEGDYWKNIALYLKLYGRGELKDVEKGCQAKKDYDLILWILWIVEGAYRQ